MADRRTVGDNLKTQMPVTPILGITQTSVTIRVASLTPETIQASWMTQVPAIQIKGPTHLINDNIRIQVNQTKELTQKTQIQGTQIKAPTLGLDRDRILIQGIRIKEQTRVRDKMRILIRASRSRRRSW